MKKLFIMSSLLSFCTAVSAQRLFQDATGNSTLYLPNSSFGYLFFNTSDNSASLGYNYFRKVGYDIKKWKAYYIRGVELKAKIKDNFGNIITNTEFNPGITASGNFGIFKEDWLLKGHFLSLFARPSIAYNAYSFINRNGNIPIVNETKKAEPSLLLNVSMQFNMDGHKIVEGKRQKDTTKHHNFFIGIQTGYKRSNNYSDLKDIEAHYRIYGTNDSIAMTIKKGKNGQYQGFNTMPLYLDFGVTPRLFETNMIGFNAYYRTNFFKTNNTHNGGMGIYIADPNKPSNIVGGVAWQFNDISNRMKSDASTLERSSLFFYIGYTIAN